MATSSPGQTTGNRETVARPPGTLEDYGFVNSPNVSNTDFCDRCGGRAGDGDHAACAAARALEPPRYCATCGRRTVVKVTPRGWSSRCARHGTTTSTADVQRPVP